MGSICVSVALGKNILVTDASTLVTKKGGISLTYHLGKRCPKLPNGWEFVLVESIDQDRPTLEKLRTALVRCTRSEEIKTCRLDQVEISSVPFLTEPTIDSTPNSPNEVRVTCGVLARHIRVAEGYYDEVNGHVTRAFGISLEESKVVEQEQVEAKIIGGTFTGRIFHLKVNGKYGGYIVSVPDLDNDTRKCSHITVNTTVKSSLSGPILEKYFDGKVEFRLGEVDEKAKGDQAMHVISIEKGEGTFVQVTGWYVYALESSN